MTQEEIDRHDAYNIAGAFFRYMKGKPIYTYSHRGHIGEFAPGLERAINKALAEALGERSWIWSCKGMSINHMETKVFTLNFESRNPIAPEPKLKYWKIQYNEVRIWDNGFYGLGNGLKIMRPTYIVKQDGEVV